MTQASLSNKIQRERKNRGWTQADLAAKSGVSVPTIQRMETAARVSGDTLKSVASAFGIDVLDLTTESPTDLDKGELAAGDYLPVSEITSGRQLTSLLAKGQVLDFDFDPTESEKAVETIGSLYEFCQTRLGHELPGHPVERYHMDKEADAVVKMAKAAGIRMAGETYNRQCYDIDDDGGMSMGILMGEWSEQCLVIRAVMSRRPDDRVWLDPEKLPKYVSVSDARIIGVRPNRHEDEELPF